MAKITLNHADARDVSVRCDLIFIDPPFDMKAEALIQVLNKIDCDHLVLITTMRQFLELMTSSKSKWVLNFDFVLDAVVPKKSRNIHQPNYIHATGVYLTRNKAKSIFSRKLYQRSDTFDNNGYWPSIIRAPRERLQDHGMAKNERAIMDIIGSFDAKHIYDCFAGSGTTGFACIELDRVCTLTEINTADFEKLERSFQFLL